jgi:hypothetical protein
MGQPLAKSALRSTAPEIDARPQPSSCCAASLHVGHAQAGWASSCLAGDLGSSLTGRLLNGPRPDSLSARGLARRIGCPRSPQPRACWYLYSLRTSTAALIRLRKVPGTNSRFHSRWRARDNEWLGLASVLLESISTSPLQTDRGKE